MRISKRALAFFLTVIMIISMVPSTVFAVDNAAGTIARAYVREDGTRVVVDMVNVTFSESVELKLYSGDTLLTTAELDTDKVAPGSYGELTGNISVSNPSSSWNHTEWTPTDSLVPNKVELVVDGNVVDTYNKVCDSNATIEIYNQISAEKWAALDATLAIGGRIYRAYLNENKGRIYLDLLNLSYSESVALELYSGDTLLTTVTLNADEYPGPANKNELTASICVENYKDSDTWLCEEWTPMDNMVPTAIKLVVDNQVVDTCTTILNSARNGEMTAEDWVNFPGTKAPVEYCTVRLVIYRNGNTSTPYATYYLDKQEKGSTLDLSDLNIADYYSSSKGFEYEGWFDDGRWNQYKAGKNPAGLESVYINGYTNLCCMVTDYQTVNLVIYRNGDTSKAYKTVSLSPVLKGDTLDLTQINVADYYSSTYGFEFEGLFDDGRWNQYKAGKNPAGMTSIKVNGWTNVICMVTDYQKVVVYGVINGNKDTAEIISNGKALLGTNLVEWLDANVTIPEKTGYTADKWYNWDWYGHKHSSDSTVNGWTNVYVDYVANAYTLTLDPNGGKVEPSTVTVTYNEAIGEMPVATRSNYIFDGWYDADGNEVTAETIYTIAGDSTVTAHWIAYPGSGSGNVTKELFTIQCTTDHDHSWVVNWLGSHVKLVSGSVHWNEELGRWEAQAKIGTSMLSLINSTQPKKNYFGGITHHYDITEFVMDLYYDPDYTGLNSQSKEVTGMWLPAQNYVVNVYCYDKPTGPSDAAVQKLSKLIWIRDAANTKNYLKPTKLYAGTYEIGAMYEENGKFYAKLTITDLTPYINDFIAKYGEDYVIGDWTKNYTLEDFTYTLVYTGSTTDYKQDGTGWSVDSSSYANKTEKYNGKTLWLTKQYTVTYTDGVEGVELFADQSYTVYAMTETARDKFVATATPAFDGTPSRTGYDFAGWSPAWAENVSGDVTYTATWNAHTYSIKYNGGDGSQYVGSEPNSRDNWVIVKNGYTYDQPVTLHDGTGFVRTGYNLVGWTINGETYALGETVEKNFTSVQNGTVQAYAIWEPITYSIKYNGGDGSQYVGSEPNSRDNWVIVKNGYTYDAENTLHDGTGFVRTGYTLVGWTINGETYALGQTVNVNFTSVQNGTVQAYAIWTANTYTIKYNGGDNSQYVGSEPNSGDNWMLIKNGYTYDAPVTLDNGADFTRTGYTLIGWLINGQVYGLGETVNVNFTHVQSGTVNAYAVWSANTYTVTFDPNGGNVNPTSKEVIYDSIYGELPAPTRTGYTFGSWTNEAGATVTADDVYKTAGNSTLFATWTANTYTLTLDANGGTVEPSSVTVTYDAAISELPEPVRTGYTFAGWVDANGNAVTAATVYTVADNSTITATWTANTYTLTLNANGGTVSPETVEVTYDAAVGELPVPEKTGYTFIGWMDASGAKVLAETIYTVADNSTLTAEWSANAYKITLDANGGKLEEADSELNVTFGATVNTMPVPTKTGYTFAGWYDEKGNEYTAETVYSVAGDITLSAKWTANEYTVTLDAGKDATVEPATLTATYDAVVGELPVPTKTGYTFAGWVDADGKEVNAETVYAVADNSTLTAKWTANTYTVTLNADGGKVDPATVTVTYNEAVGELPVPTRDGYSFDGWMDANNNKVTAETVYTLTADSELNACWIQIDTDNAKTGDTVMIGIAITMMIACVAVLLILNDRKRRMA